MGSFKRVTMPLAKIKANQQNPRVISESKLKKLINSLLVFPKMMTLRPITLDENDFVLGGNMRQTALNRISQMSKEQLQETIEQTGEYQAMTDDERQATLKYWLRFLKKPQVEVQVASDLTEDERQQFIIKDNVSFGDWDYDELENWDNAKLESWGLDTSMPDFNGNPSDWGGQNNDKERTITETEKLSEVKFTDAYYQPKQIPDITLRDCINTELFEKKIAFVQSLDLSDEMKEVMRLLAYRFIRIDFESVANYYAFNATDEEKRAIERLRCVLVDGSLDGFIGDSLLRVHQHFYEQSEENEENDDEENG